MQLIDFKTIKTFGQMRAKNTRCPCVYLNLTVTVDTIDYLSKAIR